MLSPVAAAEPPPSSGIVVVVDVVAQQQSWLSQQSPSQQPSQSISSHMRKSALLPEWNISVVTNLICLYCSIDDLFYTRTTVRTKCN